MKLSAKDNILAIILYSSSLLLSSLFSSLFNVVTYNLGLNRRLMSRDIGSPDISYLSLPFPVKRDYSLPMADIINYGSGEGSMLNEVGTKFSLLAVVLNVIIFFSFLYLFQNGAVKKFALFLILTLFNTLFFCFFPQDIFF